MNADQRLSRKSAAKTSIEIFAMDVLHARGIQSFS
jgi:hypothetical protein